MIKPDVCCPCACRDCMEITYGGAGSFCHACQDADCTLHAECRVEPEPDSEPEPELGLGVAEALVQCVNVLGESGKVAERIRAECAEKGFSIVSHGTYDPRLIIPRLIGTLIALDPQDALAARDSRINRLLLTMPLEALENEQHEYWAGAEAERLITELSIALNRAAPAGFMFTAEGAWHNMGFFRA